MSHRCGNFRTFMADQVAALRRAIDEDKWYESEAVGRDVGEYVAMAHFLDLHLVEWAARFRADYCGCICEYRGECAWRAD